LVLLPDDPIKTFTLRDIKDSPPYLHYGRLRTLADCVEFFNLVLGTKLTQEEKDSLSLICWRSDLGARDNPAVDNCFGS
jgi:cytochrome c peroxidase